MWLRKLPRNHLPRIAIVGIGNLPFTTQTWTAGLDIESIIWLDVDMMHGIEYEFPARIAEVAMWLIDHQMNMLISNEFGQYCPITIKEICKNRSWKYPANRLGNCCR